LSSQQRLPHYGFGAGGDILSFGSLKEQSAHFEALKSAINAFQS
jgi:hypothetical protein